RIAGTETTLSQPLRVGRSSFRIFLPSPTRPNGSTACCRWLGAAGQKERRMDDPKVIIVMLRQPRLDSPNEMRTDPLWEFGSFGCTGCHRKNLMNPNKLTELNGT